MRAAYELRERERMNRKHARVHGAHTEVVDYAWVIEDAAGVCYLCGHEIEMTGPSFLASIEFDHVVPLSRGGSHIRENIGVTHRTCNRRKGNRDA